MRLGPLDRPRPFAACLRCINDPEATEPLLAGDLPVGRLAESDFFDRQDRGVSDEIVFAIETTAGGIPQAILEAGAYGGEVRTCLTREAFEEAGFRRSETDLRGGRRANRPSGRRRLYLRVMLASIALSATLASALCGFSAQQPVPDPWPIVPPDPAPFQPVEPLRPDPGSLQGPIGVVPDPLRPRENLLLGPLSVAETERLAITPRLDGVLSEEEWDLFASDGEVVSYFQWEPRRLHAAARARLGMDVVFSFDLRGNGWLVGQDNIEVRVAMVDGEPVASVRRLDATAVEGPRWVDSPALQQTVRVAASAVDDDWIVEMTLEDPGDNTIPRDPGNHIGVGIGVVEAEAELEPFLPRQLVRCRLVLDRGSNVPGGMRWNTQVLSRTVMAGRNIRIRLTFNGSNELGLRRVEMRTEGPQGSEAVNVGRPFPAFDRRGRAFVDYDTPISESAADGWRVLRADISDEDGMTAVLRTSYRVAPPVEFDLIQPARVRTQDDEQVARFSVYVRSNSTRRVDGVFRVIPPEGWSVESGQGSEFIIVNSRGSVRRVFDVKIPQGTIGVFPFRLEADLGGRVFTQLVWVTMGR